jgi:cell division protein FtsB
MPKKEKIQINLLQVVIIFLLGILIATNVFFYLQVKDLKGDLVRQEQEISKLKADDIAIAQVINNLFTQLQNLGIIKPPAQVN